MHVNERGKAYISTQTDWGASKGIPDVVLRLIFWIVCLIACEWILGTYGKLNMWPSR